MMPLCMYGFPCLHTFSSDDDDPICCYPYKVTDPKEKLKELEDETFEVLYDQDVRDCPLSDHIKMYKHIVNMSESLCPQCIGYGWVCNYKGVNLPLERIECPGCKGTGIKAEGLKRKRG